MRIEDLDILRPEPRLVKLGGNEIDVSFIPCAITFELDRIMGELSKISQEDVTANSEVTRRAFDLSIDLCVAFCSHKHPDMDREWFMENVDAGQVRVFALAVREALQKAYAGGEPKNAEPPKVRRRK